MGPRRSLLAVLAVYVDLSDVDKMILLSLFLTSGPRTLGRVKAGQAGHTGGQHRHTAQWIGGLVGTYSVPQ